MSANVASPASYVKTWTQVLLLIVLGIHSAQAADISFSGYGTFGYSQVLDNDTVNFQTGFSSGGTDSDGSFLLDTRLGLQADATLSQSWSATTQMVLKENVDAEFEPRAEWAFLKYQLNDVWSFRAGRLNLPVFALSDYREVGYAMPWARAPAGFYRVVPSSSFQGADILADFSFADFYINAQFYVGGTDQRITPDTRSGSNGYGLSLDVEYGSWRLRFGQLRADISSDNADFNQLLSGVNAAAAFAPQLQPLAELLQTGTPENPAEAVRSAIGIDLNFDSAFINVEYAEFASAGWIPDLDSVLVGGGVQIGAFTPYLAYSFVSQKNLIKVPTLPPVPELQALGAGIEAITADQSQRNFTAGVRWDFRPNFAFKAQYETITRVDRGISFDALSNPNSLDDGGDVGIMTLSIDVIF